MCPYLFGSRFGLPHVRSCFSAWRPARIDWISVMTVSGLMLLRSVFENLRLPDVFADVLLARL